jgi:DNA-directed RNA polymerase subunit RPC12/RpoP
MGVIDEIRALPHFRTYPCKTCGGQVRIHALQMYGGCIHCGERRKLRAFGGIGTEIQDVIDAVLEWAGEGESWEAVLRRREEILAERDDDEGEG